MFSVAPVVSSAGEVTGGMGASVINKDGDHPVVLVCEHASHHIPAKFNNLGLSGSHLQSHIAWDPGAMETARGHDIKTNAKT